MTLLYETPAGLGAVGEFASPKGPCCRPIAFQISGDAGVAPTGVPRVCSSDFFATLDAFSVEALTRDEMPEVDVLDVHAGVNAIANSAVNAAAPAKSPVKVFIRVIAGLHVKRKRSR